jgi:putative transposase
MTHDDDARVADLLARLGDGDTKELFRRLLEHGMQELIDAELTAAIGAAPHERTDARSNQRNGVRSRLLSTPAGDVELRIPKLRVGSFFPSLLEPRRRIASSRHAAPRPRRYLIDISGPDAHRSARPALTAAWVRCAE